MKKRNLKVPLRQFGGAEVKIKKIENGIVVVDAEGNPVMETVLVSDQLGQLLWEKSTSNATPEEKYQAFKIAQRIAVNPEAVELSTKDTELVKKVAAMVYDPGYYGQIVDLLECK